MPDYSKIDYQKLLKYFGNHEQRIASAAILFGTGTGSKQIAEAAYQESLKRDENGNKPFSKVFVVGGTKIFKLPHIFEKNHDHGSAFDAGELIGTKSEALVMKKAMESAGYDGTIFTCIKGGKTIQSNVASLLSKPHFKQYQSAKIFAAAHKIPEILLQMRASGVTIPLLPVGVNTLGIDPDYWEASTQRHKIMKSAESLAKLEFAIESNPDICGRFNLEHEQALIETLPGFTVVQP